MEIFQPCNSGKLILFCTRRCCPPTYTRAELGVYYGGGPHWKVDTNLSMPMTLALSHKGTNIISHTQNTWWITGFNSNYLNVKANDPTATFSIDFSENIGMYNSFKNTHVIYGNKWIGTWTFNDEAHIATLVH